MKVSQIATPHKERKRELLPYLESEVENHEWSFHIAQLVEGAEWYGQGRGYEAYILAIRKEEEMLQRAIYKGKKAVDHFICCQRIAATGIPPYC